jgi:hypothetical protein
MPPRRGHTCPRRPFFEGEHPTLREGNARIHEVDVAPERREDESKLPGFTVRVIAQPGTICTSGAGFPSR